MWLKQLTTVQFCIQLHKFHYGKYSASQMQTSTQTLLIDFKNFSIDTFGSKFAISDY